MFSTPLPESNTVIPPYRKWVFIKTNAFNIWIRIQLLFSLDFVAYKRGLRVDTLTGLSFDRPTLQEPVCRSQNRL